MMNSTRTGPIEGTSPPAAKMHEGASKNRININNLFLFFREKKPGNLFIPDIFGDWTVN
jgi:hypothetical protein